jgi:hypothetical protein
MSSFGPPAVPVATATAIPVAVTNTINNATEGLSNISNSVVENVSNASDYVKGSLSSFGDASVVDASSDFLNSNTMIAKFAFLLLVLIGFLFMVHLGVRLIGYFTKPKGTPLLVSGTMNAANEVTIYQDPKMSQAMPILRSNNQSDGIEFTWCLWIYINDINTTGNGPQYSNIFNKGNAAYGPDGLATVNNGPGLYLDNKGHQLVLVMNTVDPNNFQNMLYIKDMPLRKWFHCSVRLENTAMDIYINGVIAGRMIMQDVPKQNYENVNICKNGGFNGNIADLQYYNTALSVFQINNIVVWGRNTSASDSAGTADATGFPYYLSNLWYSSNY